MFFDHRALHVHNIIPTESAATILMGHEASVIEGSNSLSLGHRPALGTFIP